MKFLLIVCTLLHQRLCSAGIFGLSKYFRSTRNKDDVWTTQSENSDHLAIDMNQVIYGSIKSIKSPRIFMSRIFKELDDVINLCKPKKSLVLCFDGAAPYAKMQTQRIRRLQRADSSIITPGTTMMSMMKDMMLCYVSQRLEWPLFRNLSIYISDASNPGEGELKIIDWLNTQLYNRSDTVIICGSDSDICLQALCLNNFPNLKVLQRKPGPSTPDLFCNISALLRDLILVSQPRIFSNATIHSARNHSGSFSLEIEQEFVPESIHLDLVILFILQGNDYLPKLRGVNFNSALKAYGVAMRRLPIEQRFLIDVNTNTFNFVALRELMLELRSDVISLPVNIPTATSFMYGVLQRSGFRGELNWTDHEYSTGFNIGSSSEESALVTPSVVDLELNNMGKSSFAASVKINDTLFSTGAMRYSSKREARKAVAEHFLKVSDTINIDRMRCTDHINSIIFGDDILNVTVLNVTSVSIVGSVSEGGLLYSEYLRSRSMAKKQLEVIRLSVLREQHGVRAIEESANQIVRAVGTDGEYSINRGSRSGHQSRGIDDYGTSFDGVDATMKSDEYSEKGVVSEEDYQVYVKDSDVVQYLSGVLWVLQMYADGICPDLSYTFAGRVPITCTSVVRYIDNVASAASSATVDKEGSGKLGKNQSNLAYDGVVMLEKSILDELGKRIAVPVSNFRPLSPEATCVSLIPALVHVPADRDSYPGSSPVGFVSDEDRGESSLVKSRPAYPGSITLATDSVPVELRSLWREVQVNLFDKLSERESIKLSYADFTKKLEAIFDSCNSVGAHKVFSDSATWTVVTPVIRRVGVSTQPKSVDTPIFVSLSNAKAVGGSGESGAVSRSRHAARMMTSSKAPEVQGEKAGQGVTMSTIEAVNGRGGVRKDDVLEAEALSHVPHVRVRGGLPVGMLFNMPRFSHSFVKTLPANFGIFSTPHTTRSPLRRFRGGGGG